MSTHHYLVSFCNNKLNSGGQGLIGQINHDPTSGTTEYQPITLRGLEQHEPKGITGLCHHGDGFIGLLQAKNPQLLFLDTHFNVTRQWNLEGKKGIHTILSRGEYIYFSVTGQDLICRSKNGVDFETLWSSGNEHDTIHLNSICFYKERLYFTAFGPKAEDNLWSSARNGFVQSIDNNTPTKEGIWHPHSLHEYAGQLYYCNSSHQQIESLDVVLYQALPGYARGLNISDDLIVCGTSKGRLVSHSTGQLISNIGDRGVMAGDCGVWIANRHSNSTTHINLNQHATEVFEIIKVN